MLIEIPLWLVVLGVILLVTGPLAVWLWQQMKFQGAPTLPSEWALTARAVFSTEERRLYRVLKDALPNHVIVPKLALVRFCQPVETQQIKYWYKILGAHYVSFAISSPNGRVLAAIDIDKAIAGEAALHRSIKIKRAVLHSCRVRYLRTPSGRLPSVDEILALLPKAKPNSSTANSTRPLEKLLDSGVVTVPGTPGAAVATGGAATPAQAPPPSAVKETSPPLQAISRVVDEAAPSHPTVNAGFAPPNHTPPVRISQTIRHADAAPLHRGKDEAHEEALTRAREALADTVAARRAQRNIVWQESSVFQDSFFALDSRLEDPPEAEPRDPRAIVVTHPAVKIEQHPIKKDLHHRASRAPRAPIEEARYATSTTS